MAEQEPGKMNGARRLFARHWPAAIPAALAVGASLLLLRRSIALNDGLLIYSIDDPYIHMALAKNFVLHGVWGVSPYQFAPASSSPGWTLLLSGAFALFGLKEWLPFAMNIFAGTGAAVAAYALAFRMGGNRAASCAAACAAVALIPLPAMAMEGMEHSLHAAVALLFALACVEALQTPGGAAERWAVVLAVILPAVRYEGLFEAAAAFLLFVLAGRARFGFLLAAAAWVSPLIYAAYAMPRGGYFFPNPLLMKGVMPRPDTLQGVLDLLGGRAVSQAWENPAVLGPIIAAALLVAAGFVRGRKIGIPAQFLPSLFVVTSALHLELANTGWYFRYEAYMVGFGVTVAAAAASSFFEGRWRAMNAAFAALVLFASAAPGLARAAEAFRQMPYVSHNEYRMQYQMGKFLARYYRGQGVMLHDIGVPCWAGDLRVLDIAGLASTEVVRARRGGYLNAGLIYALSARNNVRVAVLFEGLFQEPLFRVWPRAGRWLMARREYEGMDISFFAVDPAELPALRRNLGEFNKNLPPSTVPEGL